MTNHTPVFTSSSATGSFTEFANTNDSTALHTLSGTMSFKDSDRTDTHTTTATLHSAVLSSGTIIPRRRLRISRPRCTSQILSDTNGSGQLKWNFSDQDQDFDFLAKNQTLVLTYDIKVSDNHGGYAIQTVKITRHRHRRQAGDQHDDGGDRHRAGQPDTCRFRPTRFTSRSTSPTTISPTPATPRR